MGAIFTLSLNGIGSHEVKVICCRVLLVAGTHVCDAGALKDFKIDFTF